MEVEGTKSQLTSLSIKYGLIIGAIAVVLSVVYRIVNPLFQFTNTWVQLFSLVVVIVLLVIFGKDVRQKIGGYWTFGEAFKSLLIMSVFITLLSVVYNFILFKFIDPELATKVNDAMVDKLNNQLSGMGMEQSKIDEVTKQFTNGEFKAKLEPSFKNMAMNFAIGLIIYAVIDLIIAAIIKKKPPMFAPVADDETTAPTV